MTKRFQIIHLGNPYDFVVKDHQTNRTYGTFQGDEKSMEDMLNNLHKEIQQLDKTIEELDNCQKGQSHRINDLYLENKQLKDLIIHLGYTIKYDGYRHITLELKE